MKKFSADIIFPVSSTPIINGSIIVDDEGMILDVTHEKYSDAKHYSGAIVPGFVNTHCHLELSYLKNAMPEQTGLDDFIKHIEEKRRKFTEQDILNAIVAAETEMIQNGIVAVGDISNDHYSFGQKRKKNIYYHTFIEVLGFHPNRAEVALEKANSLVRELRMDSVSITPHAPYSASEKLLKLVGDCAVKNNSILTIHNQENADEDEMFKTGTGKIIERLRSFGINTDHYQPTGTSSLQSVMPYLLQAKKIVLVHNTFTSQQDIDWLKQYGASKTFFCLCPNANLYIENKLPDVAMIMQSGIPVTIGTDSLASNHQLSILAEIQTLLKHTPSLTFEQALTWATLNGAQFLGVDDTFGSIEKNKTPGLIHLRAFDLACNNPLVNSKVDRIV